MSTESKDEEKDIYRDGQTPDQDALCDAFIQICHPQNSDKQAITLNDFICGLIQFGINDLSNKQMTQIFNFMDIDNTNTINQDKFIQFLSTSTPNNNENDDPNLPNPNQPNEQHKLQMILLNELIEISLKQKHENDKISNNPTKSQRESKNEQQLNLTLEQSDFYEFTYIPIKPAIFIYHEYEQQIVKLKSQLKEAIATLKETVNNNAVHIGEHQQVITQLKYSLLKKEKEEEATEIFIGIQSSLEPQSDYNPLEWNTNDVIDWLEMINLSKYAPSFRLHKINGSTLLNNIYKYNNQQFMDVMKFQTQQDIDKFIHEINILKQTAPQIYDPHAIEPSPSPSTSTESDSYEREDRFGNIDEDEDESESQSQLDLNEESKDDDDDDESSEAEDFDFSWMKQYVGVLLPKFEDYYEPDDTKFYRDDLRNFFPDCEDEQIDDIFEYFEDDNGYDTEEDGDGAWINVTQIIQLLKESEKEPGEDGEPRKAKKQRVGVGIAEMLEDELAQFPSSSDETDDSDGPPMQIKQDQQQGVKKKKRKDSGKKGTAAIFAAIDDFDSSSDGDNGGGGFFTSDKKRGIEDFDIDDSDDDDFGLTADLNSKPKKPKKKDTFEESDDDVLNDGLTNDGSKKPAIDPTKLLPGSKPKKAKKKKKVKSDPFATSSDEDDDDAPEEEEQDLFANAGKKKKAADPFGSDSDDDDDDTFAAIKKAPEPKGKTKGGGLDMFGDSDSDDDGFGAAPSKSKAKAKPMFDPTKMLPGKGPPKKIKPPKSGSDMFGDSDSDDDGFGAAPSKPKAKKPTPGGGGGGMFDDEEEDPLFASMKPSVESKKEISST